MTQTTVKKLDYKLTKWQANGVNYTVLPSIPLARYIAFQKLTPRLTFGTTFPEMFKNLAKAYEALNNRKFADSAVLIHNMMNGIRDVENENRHEAALMICAIFIVRDNEDITTIDEQLMKEKIKDWELEGFEINGFFNLALITIEGFRQTFVEYIQKQL